MDYSPVFGCSRNLLFGGVIGGLVGGVAGAVDAISSEMRRVPRRAPKDAARAALAVGITGAVGTGIVFATYHASKCALGVTRRSHGYGEAAVATASGVSALMLGLVVRPRPNLVSCTLLIVLDNAPLIMPLFRGE